MDLKKKGIIFDIKKYALHDGPGIRTTVFFKGCPLSCWWCHNPEGQKPGIEKFYVKNPDSSYQVEIVGREISVNEVMAEIEKEIIFYDESGGGVTFSGGEPLMQPDFLNLLLDGCRERGIATTLDTSGYATWETIEKIKDKVDLFLYDIKIIDDNDHQKYTGVSNRPILSNFERLDKEGKEIFIRFPVIPGITDTEDEIDRISTLLEKLVSTKVINLIPYHKIGKSKYDKFNFVNRLKGLNSPSTERLEQLSRRFGGLGFEVKIGG